MTINLPSTKNSLRRNHETFCDTFVGEWGRLWLIMCCKKLRQLLSEMSVMKDHVSWWLSRIRFNVDKYPSTAKSFGSLTTISRSIHFAWYVAIWKWLYPSICLRDLSLQFWISWKFFCIPVFIFLKKVGRITEHSFFEIFSLIINQIGN